MPEQSHSTGAVFLSYASQDAEAAARICEALRAAGVEVWLDKSELRGGDAWDSQIKKHIHECAIFIPVISAHSDARTEGYFRREWKLATRRLLDMADDAPFLVPVVIDETREADARVPEEFLHAHWTRLPGGETPPEFAQRVRHLLGGDSAAVHTAPSAGTGTIETCGRKMASVPPRLWPARKPSKHRVLRVGLAFIALLLVLGGGAFWYYQGARDAPAAKPEPATASPIAAAAPNEKSIAVLPFVNMSGDTANEYFADGLSEELLNLLAKNPELRVAARTSAFKFKGERVNLQEVAQKLNVTHVLEGSVRKSGDKVRITAQLIKAADGYHLWSETYDRTLKDIFVVQDDIAGAVVKALQVILLSPALGTHSKPQDPEAYNLALQGRYFVGRPSQENFERSIIYFRQSLERDPGYAPAWEGLSRAYFGQADMGFVPVADGYRRAREAANKALTLDPQLVDAQLSMGWIQSGYDWDWEAADARFRRALELEPGNPRALTLFGTQAAIYGRWNEAIDALNKAIERDPLAPNRHMSLGHALQSVNRDTEAESAFRKGLELDPDGAWRHSAIGRSLLLQGKTQEALQEMQREKEENGRLYGLSLVFHTLGRRSESEAALATLKRQSGGEMAYQIAEVHAFRGEAALAFAWLERAYNQRDGGVTEIKGDRLFGKLIDDPRYKAFLRKLKLPE